MKRIMLVEDDATMRSLLKTLLELENYEIFAYGEGTEETLIEELKRVQPDALLLDVKLRQANGLEILRRVRLDHATEDLPVLVSSGRDMQTEALEQGANAFLLKPYETDQLITWLRQV